MSSLFADMVADPGLLPGVYSYCDQWCSYCPVTARCLVYRARARWEERHGGPRETIEDAVAFTREVARAAGGRTPELDALESGQAVRKAGARQDLAERLVTQYAFLASMFLQRSGWRPPSESAVPSTPPAPLDVVGWYHLQIAAKVGRAFDGLSPAVGNLDERRADAVGSAKVALIGIERSRRALELLEGQSPQDIIEAMLHLLELLNRRLTKRFPGARAFVRPGLDCPVA